MINPSLLEDLDWVRPMKF